MRGYSPATYGDHVADCYDDLWAGARSVYGRYDVAGETEGTLSFVRARTAPGDRVLELGVGTGRIAIPLARSGRAVDGVDASAEMLTALRNRLQGEPVTPIEADMADFATGRRYPLAFVTFSTFFALTTQDAQLSCMRRVADHLHDGGLFVLDVFLPHGLPGDTAAPFDLSTDSVWLDVAQHDPLAQVTRSHHVVLRADGTFRLYPLVLRYAGPAELDLMARLAGLELHERYEDWSGAPLRATSTRHISVYRKGVGDR